MSVPNRNYCQQRLGCTLSVWPHVTVCGVTPLGSWQHHLAKFRSLLCPLLKLCFYQNKCFLTIVIILLSFDTIDIHALAHFPTWAFSLNKDWLFYLWLLLRSWNNCIPINYTQRSFKVSTRPNYCYRQFVIWTQCWLDHLDEIIFSCLMVPLYS